MITTIISYACIAFIAFQFGRAWEDRRISRRLLGHTFKLCKPMRPGETIIIKYNSDEQILEEARQ